MGDKCVTYAEELDLLPTAVGFMWDNVFRHEVVGCWWYRIFRQILILRCKSGW